jgi:hypothetical protein
MLGVLEFGDAVEYAPKDPLLFTRDLFDDAEFIVGMAGEGVSGGPDERMKRQTSNVKRSTPDESNDTRLCDWRIDTRWEKFGSAQRLNSNL